MSALAYRIKVSKAGFASTSKAGLSVSKLTPHSARELLQLRDVKVHAVYIERDGFEPELLHYDSPRSPEPGPAHAMNDLGFTHLSIRLPNLEEAMAALEAAGVEATRSTFIKMGGIGVAVLAKDPDGLLIELVLAPPERAA